MPNAFVPEPICVWYGCDVGGGDVRQAVIESVRRVGHHEAQVYVGNVVPEQEAVRIGDPEFLGGVFSEQPLDMRGMYVPARHSNHHTLFNEE